MQDRGPDTASLSDESLLTGFAVGDVDTGAAFVRRFQHRVFGLAVSVVGDRAGAEDVAQEAFVRAWRHAGSYDSRRGSVATWLLTITRNLAIDQRRARRAVVLDPFDLVDLAIAPGGGPSIVPERVTVRDALLRVPEDQRRALVRAAIGGLTAQEISELDGIPLGTAKTRIRTGLRRLRTLLQDDEAVAEGQADR